jgi:hypothetical protein
MRQNLTFVLSFALLFNCLYAQVSVERNFDLELAEKDSVTSARIKAALNGFLTEAQESRYSTKYVDSTHLLQYKFFFDKLSGIGQNSTKFNKPLVLKSYPIGAGVYRLTVGFTGISDDGPFIYQITELKAVPDKESYRFYCPFPENTEHFQKLTFDNVTYHFSSSIDESKAAQFADFTQELSELTNVPVPILDYYSFKSLDELLKAYGFLYSARHCNFLCYDLGFTDNQGSTYITGTNNENYVFGFIGDFLYYNLPERERLYWPFIQGISTYYGGYGLSYDNMETLKSQFREELSLNPNINFLQEFKKGRKSSVKRHFSYFVMCAFLYEEALNKKGFQTALKLAFSGNDGEDFFKNMELILGVNENNFHRTILRLIEE